MAICGVCAKFQSKRTISGIPMCENCFSKLQKLRSSDIATVNFFLDDSNLVNATSEAKIYLKDVLAEKYDIIEQVRKEKEREQYMTQKEAEKEEEKRAYANSFDEYYEYDVATILNVNEGQIDKIKMVELMTEMSKKGWRLHTVYSNELGKNAASVLGFGVNETVCEDVFIFERRIQRLSDLKESN